MSFFKNLLNFKKSKAKGHRLGDYSGTNADNNITNNGSSSGQGEADDDLEAEFETLLTTCYEFDVVFTEKLLGCKLGKGSDQLTYVVSCEPNSPADLNDVKRSDKIIAIDGDPVGSYHDVLGVFSAIGRPVTITFHRNEAENMKKILTIGSTGSNNNNSNNSSNTNTTSIAKTSNSTTSNNNLSTEQAKQQRRELMAKAAQERTAAWDKRVAAASGKRVTAAGGTATTDSVTGRPLYDHSIAATVGSLNPETQRNVQAAKRAEQKQVQAMGYNPFQPHMSFANSPTAAVSVTANATTNAPSSSSSSGKVLGAASSSGGNNELINSQQQYYSNNSPDEDDTLDVDEADVIDAVDDAFALLMSGTVSLTGSGSDSSSTSAKDTVAAMQIMEVQINTALLTVMKMLSSLHKNKQEVKFRSIRLMNENFQTKVAAVPGGLDLMLAAGFALEAVATSGSGSNSNSSTSAAGAAASQDVFLRHDMSLMNERKLDYTLQRLTELQESA